MKKKENKNYLKSFIVRVLIAMMIVICGYSFTSIKILDENINLLKLPFYFSKLLPTQIKLSDETVYSKLIYDNVTFDGKKNNVINYSFNGVLNLTDGIIIKIIKNHDQSYNVTIQDVNGYLFEYANLKSVDFSIYSFVESQTILGSSSFDDSINGYCFDLYISKKGEYYDFYELAEG